MKKILIVIGALLVVSLVIWQLSGIMFYAQQTITDIQDKQTLHPHTVNIDKETFTIMMRDMPTDADVTYPWWIFQKRSDGKWEIIDGPYPNEESCYLNLRT